MIHGGFGPRGPPWTSSDCAEPQLAVDDLGAGYAGLRQVMRLQPDVLKLDLSLVSGVSTDPAKAPMIDALVRYARRIGAVVCAEGIETMEDLEALADLDVTLGQGYALARPGEPWADVDPRAARLCTSALRSVIRGESSSNRSHPKHRGRIGGTLPADQPGDRSGRAPSRARANQASAPGRPGRHLNPQ